VDGQKVAVRWTARATHAGRFAAIEPTGRQVRMLGMTIFQTTPAQIEALWNIWDVAGLLQQIQATP
jgi:predicted ester cyclase